ncbi:MAG: hypothetical protein WDM90_16280 [Ferruginibacter sp.]
MITPEEETILAQKIKMGDQGIGQIGGRPTFVLWYLWLSSTSTRAFLLAI